MSTALLMSARFRLIISGAILLVFILCAITKSSAQNIITGRVINGVDRKPISNVNVFLRNTSTGTQTNREGYFKLQGMKSGRYELIVSIVGYDRENIKIDVDGPKQTGDIMLFLSSNALREVVIKPNDPHRSTYYKAFVREFIGSSPVAKDCKIVNPEVIDFSYDDLNKTLTATSNDFIIIKNQALGYRVKYLLNNFTYDDSPGKMATLHYDGSVLFEQLPGNIAQMLRWQQTRLQVYEGSAMHFLRSAVNCKLDENGFRVQQDANIPNPHRPPDMLILTKIARYQSISSKVKGRNDSLEAWRRRWNMPRIVNDLRQYNLTPDDFIQRAAQKGLYYLNCDSDQMLVTYSKEHDFKSLFVDVNSPRNKKFTAITFNAPKVLFNDSGDPVDLAGMIYSGVWGRNRVAELLPSDYEPEHANPVK